MRWDGIELGVGHRVVVRGPYDLSVRREVAVRAVIWVCRRQGAVYATELTFDLLVECCLQVVSVR